MEPRVYIRRTGDPADYTWHQAGDIDRVIAEWAEEYDVLVTAYRTQGPLPPVARITIFPRLRRGRYGTVTFACDLGR